jgi:cytochrome c6
MKTNILIFVTLAFSLLISCGSDGSKEKATEAPKKEVAAAPVVDNVAAGEKVFRTYCIVCHGIDGALELNGAKDLSKSVIAMEERVAQITNGKGLMTPFKGILSEDQINQVAEYTFTLKTEE